jgi:hypothetical protein
MTKSKQHEQTTPDWAQMVEQLMDLGMTIREIGQSMHLDLTGRMLLHYRNGAQPPHWRGEGLIGLWCNKTGAKREELPQMLLIRGHRAKDRGGAPGPRLQELPNWPHAVPVSVAPVKRGRPKKTAVAV